jgi:hypothetical protein
MGWGQWNWMWIEGKHEIKEHWAFHCIIIIVIIILNINKDCIYYLHQYCYCQEWNGLTYQQATQCGVIEYKTFHVYSTLYWVSVRVFLV